MEWTKIPTQKWCQLTIDIVSSFNIRGKNYLDDKQKVSASELPPFVAGDMWASLTKNKQINLPQDNCVNTNYPQKIWLMYHLGDIKILQYFYRNSEWSDKNTTFLLWNKLCDQSIDISKYLKMITKIDNVTTQKIVGNKPVILGNKINIKLTHISDNILRIDLNLYSSIVAKTILKTLKSFLPSITVDLGFLLEGKKPEELPESLLFGIRIQSLGISEIEKLCKNSKT